jgi:hypothetical protein
MTTQIKRVLLTLASGSALAVAPLLYGTVVVPAISHADQAKGMNCPDGTIVDDENKQCVDLTSGIAKQLAALPPPPKPASEGGGGGGLPGGLSTLPGGIPSLGTVNLPDIVLPSVGLGLVPNLAVNLQPQLPYFNPLNLP